MNLKQIAQNNRRQLPFLSLACAALIGVFLITAGANHRQYSPNNIVKATHEDEENDKGALGMMQFFFNVRKNIATNAMDYPSMLAADIADRAMSNAHNTHGPSAVPSYTWNSVGPTNIGGRTRAFLIDQNDPTHQTLFAGGVSGGIWKSINGGGTWDNGGTSGISLSLNDNLANINVSCIAQDANGAIYIGTGEGFSLYSEGEGVSTAMLGGGIYKSTDDGNTWRSLTKTVPNTANNAGVAWAYVNRIAIRPDSFKVIYAATNLGLYISHDSGATWSYAVNSANSRNLTSNSLDIKISNDGSVVVACIGGTGYYCYPQTNDNTFTEIKNIGAGHLPASGDRIEFAIAPSDPNRIYASYVDPSGQFGPGSSTSGIFMTETAKTNGGYWYDIGPGGSASFDPYYEGTTYPDQATYDNTLGVPPNNEGQVLCGGTSISVWTQLSPTDTVGSWDKITHNQSGAGDPLYVHTDEHAIVFDLNNPNTVYIGCDGGVFKCTNMNISSDSIIGSISHLSFLPINRNYNVTQYYTVCFSPTVNPENQLGMGGGTQDNGSPYINGASYYPNDATDVSGGDGAGCVVSSLDPNIGYFCSDYGDLLKTADLGALASPTSAYTKTTGVDAGANIDSVWTASGSNEVCFVAPVALYENYYDTLNHDSLLYIADSNYSKGHTIFPQDANGPTNYPYVLPRALAVGDSLEVPDRVVSRLAVGFCPSQGIWINCQGASTGTIIWMPIAFGSLSKPTAYTGTSPIRCLAWAPDGNTLFAGSEDGTFFRFSNINSIIANKYSSGALWYNSGKIVDTTNQVVSTSLTTQLGASGRYILSIAVDPENGNNVLVTLGNYGESTYVYYSSNALAASPTFTSVQGNLPDMPVYSAILDIRDSNGAWNTNAAMVATEHGIYTTANITAGTVAWTKNNNGMANCLCLAVKQQTLPSWKCNNSGVIYLGTHGRGLWTSNTNYQPTAVPDITSATVAQNNLLVYPNPMTNEGNISYNLAAADNITIIIYDMQGKEVKTLTMGSQSPGSHLVSFESTDIPAGVYFTSLTGNNFRKVNKFIVVK